MNCFLDTEYNSTLIPQVKDMNLDLGYSKIDFKKQRKSCKIHIMGICLIIQYVYILNRMDKDDKIEYKVQMILISSARVLG